MNWDTDFMLSAYEMCCVRKLELFNVMIKVDLGMIQRADLVLPAGLLEKQYKAYDQLSKALGLSLQLLGVEIPDIE